MRVFTITALIALCVGLSACEGYQHLENRKMDARTFSLAGADLTIRAGVLTDEDTGCQYIVASWNEPTITPRLDFDGKQICVGVKAMAARAATVSQAKMADPK